MNMYIDIVGACNLSCPSCPMGNSENLNFKKAMQLDMFKQIVAKARTEGVTSIFLYNWTEPLVHPKIGEFIEVINAAGMSSGVSTNLNLAKNMEKALLAEPGFFRISLSGFYQETYKKGHVGGDIEVVKQNMIALHEIKQRLGLSTRVDVYYHRYLDNIEEEALMREFSERLGFHFTTGYSIMMPLEKTLAIIDRDPSVTETDYETLKRLALPPYDDLVNVAQQHHQQSCSLKDNWLVIDCDGNTILCCTIFNQSEYQVGKYLDMPVAELMRRKSTQKNCVDMCSRCAKKGMHVYSMFPNHGVLERHAVNRILDFENLSSQGLAVDSELLGRAGEVSAESFDEAQYLQLNDDVRHAVATGQLKSGYQHYVLHGRLEGRLGAGVFSVV
ncbi:radical SAM protein [Pseudomonas sp. 43A]|uniref:radical SAM/SPASM domain-containing protein n=1 Tax=unclassified Pseudomonas TaxID=196821 RepID=UPI0015879D7E|nr:MULTISPECIES: radical SAM/SPASM domain-containing protein [unclassified Pseudomonas]QKV64279.1 radical SAM protein [Pseudomonas sp. 43A]QMW07578.1 radical SAM protein [Pseudomonas sp. 29A]